MTRIARLALLTSALFAPLGCDTPDLVRPTSRPGEGAIYVYRNARWVGAAVNGGASIAQNNALLRAFPVRSGKYVVTRVAAGPTLLVTMGPDRRPTSLHVDVPDGGATYVRCDFETHGFATPAALRCSEVGAEQGESEARNCVENRRGD
jgi:hypothetical protein